MERRASTNERATRLPIRRAVVGAAFALLAASCGNNDSSDSPSEADEPAGLGPTSVDDPTGEVSSSEDAPREPSGNAPKPDDTATAPDRSAYERALARFAAPSGRTLVDRPDELEGPMVKFLYVVPSFATDRARDRSGEIARYVFHANEWLASQNGGFGVRVDTFEGSLDVPFVEIETTPEEWAAWFDESLAPAAERLIGQGWPIGRGPESNGADLYFVVWEAFAGAYLKTGASGGGCRPVIDAQNAGFRMVGIATANLGDSPCKLDYGRFPFGGAPAAQQSFLSTTSASSNAIAFVDHALQLMRGLPGCGWIESPFDGQSYTVPGTDLVEIRGGFIRDLLEPQDPIAMRMLDSAPNAHPTLDGHHNTFFHITTGPLARPSCNSDAGRHPLWSDTPFYDESPTVPRRSVLDRPDDNEGRQLHAVYVKAAGAADRALDTGLEIAAALRDFDVWLREQTDGIGVRLDTFEGHLDITYLPLPLSMEEYVASGSCRGERCPSDVDFEQLLIDAGFHDPKKTYAFFYDGGISPGRLCGGARNNSRSLLINLDDFGDGSCMIPWRAATIDTWSLGHLVGHELMHTLGAVCEASEQSDGDHHSINPTDLMFSRADGSGQRLDPTRDAYWGPYAPAGCDVSADEIFTVEANPVPADGTRLHRVPVGFNDLQHSNRTWWLNLVQQAPTSSDSEPPIEAGQHDYPPDLQVSVLCEVPIDRPAATFMGRLRGDTIGSQSVAVIWVTEGGGRCIANAASSSDSGEYSLALPYDAHRNAPFADGGGYCVVWDLNRDDVFDSGDEPAVCTNNVTLRSTITFPDLVGT